MSKRSKRVPPAKRWKFPFVMIEWHDARSDCAWGDPKDDLPHAVVFHTGWIIKADRKFLTVAGSIGDDGEIVGDRTTIPRNCVEEIISLEGKGK